MLLVVNSAGLERVHPGGKYQAAEPGHRLLGIFGSMGASRPNRIGLSGLCGKCTANAVEALLDEVSDRDYLHLQAVR